jgi:UDP-N-acetyl-D-galactosamine dehydrogenase
VILSGRRINDEMGKYVVENLIKLLIKAAINVKTAKIAILGFTFKENCPDIRNTRVIDIVNELKDYGITPVIYDPQADQQEAKHEYGLDLVSKSEITNMDAVVVAVGHSDFVKYNEDELNRFYKKTVNNYKVLLDVKGIYDRKKYEELGYIYFRL